MGPGLNPNRVQHPGSDKARGSVRVQDAFDIKPSYGLDHDPGVVLVLDSFVVEDPRALVGQIVGIRTPGGRVWRVAIDDVRDHGKTVSLFFKDLTKADLPIGSIVLQEPA